MRYNEITEILGILRISQILEISDVLKILARNKKQIFDSFTPDQVGNKNR